MSDPRKAKTLGEACANGDGTYNGFRLMSWLSAIADPEGKGFTVEEVKELFEESNKVQSQSAT